MILKYRHRLPSNPADKKPPLLILLHGIGADENDLFGISSFLDERFFIVSARAPFTLPYGGFAWFELYIEPGNVSINVEQFLESREKFFPPAPSFLPCLAKATLPASLRPFRLFAHRRQNKLRAVLRARTRQ